VLDSRYTPILVYKDTKEITNHMITIITLELDINLIDIERFSPYLVVNTFPLGHQTH